MPIAPWKQRYTIITRVKSNKAEDYRKRCRKSSNKSRSYLKLRIIINWKSRRLYLPLFVGFDLPFNEHYVISVFIHVNVDYFMINNLRNDEI